MQKSYTISCCAECPACRKEASTRYSNDFFCGKQGYKIEQGTSDAVDLALIGFPEWCPLSEVELVGESLGAELKRITRQILKRLDWDFDDDTVTSISHYLSTVVDVKDIKREKEKAEGNDLFGLPAS